MSVRFPTFYLSHGGGPWPYMREEARRPFARLEASLRELPRLEAAPAERSQRLLDWERAPAAREAHPREDHLLPLHVAVGAAAQDPGRIVYREEDFLGAIALSSYRFG